MKNSTLAPPADWLRTSELGFDLAWSVKDNYEVRAIAKGKHRIRIVQPAPGATDVRLYPPAAVNELPQELASVRDEPSLLAFVRRFGLLGHYAIVPIKDRCGGDPVPWALLQAKLVRAAVETLEILEDAKKRGTKMSALARALEGTFRKGGISIGRLEAKTLDWHFGFSQPPTPAYVLTDDWPERPVEAALRVIAGILNPSLRRISYCLRLTDGELRLGFDAWSLLDVICWQIASTLKNAQWRICARPGCGRAFVAVNPKQKYHSNSCGNLHRVHRHRGKV